MIDIMKLITETKKNLREYGDSPQAKFEIYGDFFANVVKEINEKQKLLRKIDEDILRSITFPCPFCGETMVYDSSERTDVSPNVWGYSHFFIHEKNLNKTFDESDLSCGFDASYFIPDEVEDDE